MSIDIFLLALLAGHFTGDFVLQSSSLLENKKKNKWFVVAHTLIVAGVTWAFLGDVAVWPVILLLTFVHFLIDVVKLKLQPAPGGIDLKSGEAEEPDSAFAVFLADQFLHLISLIVIWFGTRQWFPETLNSNCWAELWGTAYCKGLVLISGYAMGVWGIGAALKYQMASLAREVPTTRRAGLLKGGKTIGLLERTLVLTFVLGGQPEGVAFVVAAKSVFRIGDLTAHADRIHAEYIMIGTLRSFTYALLTAFLMQWLLNHVA